MSTDGVSASITPHFLYLIGAQCTGKTTLAAALHTWLEHNQPQVQCEILRETARMTLQSHKFSRADVEAGGARCLQLQMLILNSQRDRERQIQLKGPDLVIVDRSGLDPLVYALKYCGTEAFDQMVSTEAWNCLLFAMKESTIVVCEPVESWLYDDGIRLMPHDLTDWMRIHEIFCDRLKYFQIPFIVLPGSVSGINERVSFVLSARGISTPEAQELDNSNSQ